MALERYEVFVKVAEIKNITKAAEQLNYSQSGISHIIKKMEEDLGLKLILREKNGIRLTAAGDKLLEQAKLILKQEQIFMETVSMLNGAKIGKISVGSFSSTSIKWMPEIIKQMNKKYPNIEVFLSHLKYREIEQRIKNGQIDCGFISSRHIEQCDFIPLIQDEYYVVLPKEHHLDKYEAIPIEMLSDEKIILINDGGAYGSSYYDTANILKPINPKIMQTVEDDFVALAMVKAGLGITIVPQLLLDCVDLELPVKHFAIPRYRTLGIAVKSLEEAMPLTKLFIQFVQDYVDVNCKNKVL